ncbi:MAG: squalene/phytoene synthase family protein [Alphaproteobacteria bacterium]|nr:squalene/phytoene synthase family protein [Alphaproteobacteria bacterium]
MTAKAKKIRASFSLAFVLLPRPHRLAIQALYRFCRVIDDEIDGEFRGDGQENGTLPHPPLRDAPSLQNLIAAWRHDIMALYNGELPILPENMPACAEILALKPFIRHYDWPMRDLVGLLDGMAFDVAHFGVAGEAPQNPRPLTEQEFAAYCQNVAGGIGALVLQSLGVTQAQSYPLASCLGRAMQITNILRDIAEDAAHQRVYIPQEIWQKFGYTSPAASHILSHPALNLVTHELALCAKRDYEQSFALLAELRKNHRRAGRPLRGLGFVTLMAWIYRDLLLKNRRHSWVANHAPLVSHSYWQMRKIFWLARSMVP